MVPGMSHDGTARPTASDALDRPVFRIACLAALVMVGAATAAEPVAPWPPPNSVALPPIQSSSSNDEAPLPSHSLPFVSSSTKQEPTPPREPPSSMPRPAVVERESVVPQVPDAICQTLEREIRRMLPGSSVRVKRAGNTLVVSGSARNLFEATRILTIARQNAPDRQAHIVNLLRVPGEQQIVLRAVVAEVKLSAARSLGLDFGSEGKQATILASHPAGANASTAAGNGWIGQVLNDLQDLHCAKILAAPALTTLNGQTAHFGAGGERPVPTANSPSHAAAHGVQFHTYGVCLNVRPTVVDGDRIRVSVETEVRGADAPANGMAASGLKVRTFRTTVELREGETLAMAGMIHGSASGDPPPAMPRGLRPVPADKPPGNQELIVLISPRLLRPEEKEAENRSAKPFHPRNAVLYPCSQDTPPRDEDRYLMGPRGYTTAPRRLAPRNVPSSARQPRGDYAPLEDKR